jgi:murein DD-endopeptidase MepM/ murein hydrolase activator NlpD
LFRKLALAVVLIAVLVTSGPAAHADTGTPTLSQIQDKEKQLRVQVNLAQASANTVVAEATRLQNAITVEQALVASDQSAEAAANAAVADAEQKITSLTQQGSAARKALVDRAVDLYEHPYQDTLAVLSGVSSFDELETRQVLTDAVEAKTSDLIDAVREQRLQEQSASHDLVIAQANATARRKAAQAETVNLQTALASENAVAAKLKQQISDDDSQLVALGKQEAALEAQLNASTAAYASEISSSGITIGPVGSYGLQWPIHGVVTQEFGHNGHPGIDIAAPYGTPISASGSGVVIYASWESGYGNYTCISHGGGISTCYGHQSFIGVTVGQTVTRGQFIGREGSTGYSTGPHVHFEVRVNGVVNNPRNFVPGNP